MKHVKMLGLVAMAVATTMAFTAASAPATELYSGATTLKAGTTISSSLNGTASLTTTGGTVLDTCTGGSLNFSTVNSGGAGIIVEANLGSSNITWTGCTKTTDTLEGGTVDIAYTSGLNANVSGTGFKVTVEMVVEFGGTCSFSAGTGIKLGELKGSTTGDATLAVNAVVGGATGNSFLCPTDVKWVANYTVTKSTYNGVSYTVLHATNA